LSRAGLTLNAIPAQVLEALGQARALRSLPQGMTSSVALVETDRGLRVVKRARGGLFAGWLEKEHRALTALSTTGLPTPKPLAFARTETGLVPESWLATQHLPGQTLADALSANPEPAKRTALLRSFGQALAAIHATPAPAQIPRPAPSWLDFMLEGAGENLEHFAVDGTAELLARLRANPPAPVAPTLIHGDYTIDNALVEDDRVTGVIDWSGCAVGDPRYDLALATRPQDGAFDGETRPADLEAFYAGYGGVPLSEAEASYFIGLYEFF